MMNTNKEDCDSYDVDKFFAFFGRLKHKNKTIRQYSSPILMSQE